MNILQIDGEYFLYPKNIDNIEKFVHYINGLVNIATTLYKVVDEDWTFPYLFNENIKKVGVVLTNFTQMEEVEATLITKEEYSKQFAEYVKTYCKDCSKYNPEEADYTHHSRLLTLNGECEKKKRDNSNSCI